MLCPREPAREVRRRAMSTQRKQYSAEFKARVALEALKGLKTVNELASTYGVHPTQIAHWKHRLQKEMPEIFSARRAKREHEHEAFQAQLYHSILKFFYVDITGMCRMTSFARYFSEGVDSSRPKWRWIMCFLERLKTNTSCKA